MTIYKNSLNQILGDSAGGTVYDVNTKTGCVPPARRPDNSYVGTFGMKDCSNNFNFNPGGTVPQAGRLASNEGTSETYADVGFGEFKGSPQTFIARLVEVEHPDYPATEPIRYVNTGLAQQGYGFNSAIGDGFVHLLPSSATDTQLNTFDAKYPWSFMAWGFMGGTIVGPQWETGNVGGVDIDFGVYLNGGIGVATDFPYQTDDLPQDTNEVSNFKVSASIRPKCNCLNAPVLPRTIVEQNYSWNRTLHTPSNPFFSPTWHDTDLAGVPFCAGFGLSWNPATSFLSYSLGYMTWNGATTLTVSNDMDLSTCQPLGICTSCDSSFKFGPGNSLWTNKFQGAKIDNVARNGAAIWTALQGIASAPCLTEPFA